MAPKNEQLKAQFVLDNSTLAKQIDAAGKQIVTGLQKSLASMSTNLAQSFSAKGPWQKAGTSIGGTIGGSITKAAGRAVAGIASAGASLAGSVARTLGRIVTAPLRMLMSPLGFIAGGAGVAGVVAGVGKIINAGRDLQSEQVEIQKTTNLADEAIAQLTQTLIDFANKTGVSRTAMMGLAADAGRLGVRSVADLEKFATTFIKASTATNIGADMAEEVLRVMNTIDEPVSRIDRLMSAVNELGNNLATNERRILEFLGVMPALKSMLRFTTEQLLSFAAVASTTATESGLMGTAMNNLAMIMLDAASKGGKALTVLAQTAGMAEGEFVALIRRNGYEAMMRFIVGMKRVQGEGTDLAKIFDDMGGEGSRLIRAVLSLSNVSHLFAGELSRTSTEMKQNMSLTDEFGRRLATVEFQQKRVTEILRNFFSTLNDSKLNTEIFKNLADSLQRMISAHQVELAQKFAGLMERVARVVIGLPYDLQKARTILHGMLTEPKYLHGVFENIGKWLGETITQAMTTAFTVVAEVARIVFANIFDPLFERLIQRSYKMLLWIPGQRGRAANVLTEGLADEQIFDLLKKTGPEARGRLGEYQYQGFEKIPPRNVLMGILEQGTDAMFHAFAKAREEAGYGKEAEEQRIKERDAQITKVNQDAMKKLGKTIEELTTKLLDFGDVFDVIGTKTQAALDLIEGRKQAVLGEYEAARKEVKEAQARAPRPQPRAAAAEFEARVRKAWQPLRTTLETPIRGIAKEKGVDFESLSDEQKRAAMRRYYQRNPFSDEAMQASGIRSPQYYSRQSLLQMMEGRMSEEERRLRQAKQQPPGVPWRPGMEPGRPAEQKVVIELAPESKFLEFEIKDDGRIMASVKLTEKIMRVTTADALGGR